MTNTNAIVGGVFYFAMTLIMFALIIMINLNKLKLTTKKETYILLYHLLFFIFSSVAIVFFVNGLIEENNPENLPNSKYIATINLWTYWATNMIPALYLFNLYTNNNSLNNNYRGWYIFSIFLLICLFIIAVIVSSTDKSPEEEKFLNGFIG